MKNVIILGATGGVGSDLSQRLSATGWKCFLVARHEAELISLANKLLANYAVADCSDFEQVNRVFQNATDVFGRIDAVVNCCGSVLLKPAHLVSSLEYEQVISKNITTAFATVRAAGRFLAPNGGSVILFTSAASQIGLPNHEAISAAKGAVNGLVLSASATYAGKNIRFNAIAPGLTRTPMTESIFNNENSLKVSEKMHALKRLGTTDDLVNLVDFLISDRATWITGQIIAVDGGLGSLKTN